MKKIINVFIADDHQIFIDGIIALLSNCDDIKIVGYANTGKQLLEKIKLQNPDIILMDIGMPDINGIEATEIIKKQFPTMKVIALTMYDDKTRVANMLKAGTKGYLHKNITKDELLKALHTVASGGIYYSHIIVIDNNKIKSSEDILTDREIEIIKHIVKAYTSKQIADMLHISEFTVNTHRKNIMRKLDLKNTAALVSYAMENHL